MNSGYEFNSLQFIAEGGIVSMGVAITLLLMSIASWYLIFVKAYQSLKLRKASAAYIQRFWQASSIHSVVDKNAGGVPASALVIQALKASEHYQRHVTQPSGDICNQDEFIARSMRKVMGQASTQMERGLTVLASVGSIAPFVGLFGTVWGIYHALASISLSGQATLDKVAGPVGEALIMTALGLAVAIPAVLAYNAFVRMNRNLLAETESFAQDVHVLLTTGAALRDTSQGNLQQGNTSAKQAATLHEVPA
ncbi:MAG: MotA/TolQ/ExbB proton channel family protein [Nitrosomonadales bacterium]|nr:MotA/TolQ/ExbB proton channel family protein [Nitrosomonadales bacterium]